MANRGGRWVDLTGPIYVYERDAAARMRDLQRRFPKDKFRIFGHSASGFSVQRRDSQS